MTQEVFYRKVGRRYEAVSYYDSEIMSSMPPGVHLICVLPGERSFIHRVDPAYAPVLAALRLHRDVILKSLREGAATTSSRPLTKKELAGLKAYTAVTGNDSMLLSAPSAMGIVDALERALVEAIHG